MRKNKDIICLFLAILIIWCPVLVGFTYSQQVRIAVLSLFVQAWDKDKPASSTSLRNSNPEMLANQSALETALAQDHEFSTGGTNSGNHEVLTMEEEASAGASSANELHVQAIDGGSGQPELAITSEDGDELQMTKDGDLFSSDGLIVTEGATFNGGITLGAGDDLLLSTTSDITISGNTFTVAGATGNTVVAGTLDVTGNIDPTSYETTNGGFLDEDDMSSDSATKVASQQSIKAFVDGITDPTYTGGQSHTFVGGLIIKMGNIADGGATTTLTFDTAFPNAIITAIMTPVNSVSLGLNEVIFTYTTTQLNFKNTNALSGGYNWIAIGH